MRPSDVEKLDLLGHGSEGDVFLGRIKKTGEYVAIKLSDMPEPSDSSDSGDTHGENVFKREEEVYKMAAKYRKSHGGSLTGRKVSYIPAVYHMGKWTHGDRAVVMELLGPSLKDLSEDWASEPLEPALVMKVAIHVLLGLEELHKLGYIHVDVKPQNLCLGLTGGNARGKAVVKLIDFGVAKRFIDPKTRKHVKSKKGNWMVGSVPYASIRNHQGKTLGRADDLEGLAYVLLFLLEGRLPWRTIRGDTTDTARTHKYHRMGEAKEEADEDELFEDYPSCFRHFFKRVRQLGFKDKPDYQRYITSFKKALKKETGSSDAYIVQDDLPEQWHSRFKRWVTTGYFSHDEDPSSDDDSSSEDSESSDSEYDDSSSDDDSS